ncbi:MAG: aminoglycoside 3'-phosphotransferase [Oscillospiraceae bacterium]|nr:aminoglycoside 3'-phosphotransferase [Oscillospiraceae bacterium]
MKRHLIDPHTIEFPAVFHPLLYGAKVYDSSCSPIARVYFIDKDTGYYLKTSPKGSLQKETQLTQFFHSKGLGAQVLAYESKEQDWLLTARIPGEDCTFAAYLDDPKRLCDTTAHILRQLHSMDPADCPISNRTAEYLATAESNYHAGKVDLHLFSEQFQYISPEAAWQMVTTYGKELRADTLIHGDYCLPNIMLNDWNFSGFLDLDTGGIGDRHVDLFWGAWSLNFNLKTDRYRERFLDAYGRHDICPELFPVIAAIEIFG